MKKGILIPKNYFYRIISMCSGIILIECLDIIINFKSTIYSIFNYKNNMILNHLNGVELYLKIQLIKFLMRVVPIMILGLHTYFSFIKFRITYSFPVVWIMFSLGLFAYTLIQFPTFPILHYIKLVGYCILIICLINLFRFIKKEGDKKSATV